MRIHPALAGSAALAVAMGIGRFAFTPQIPLMQDAAGLSLTDAAWLASANYLGYLVGSMSAGRLRAHPDAAIRAGLIGIALVTAAMAWPGGFAWWAALRFAAGVMSAWVLIHVSAWSLARLGRRAGRLGMGLVFAGIGAGIVVAGLVCLAAAREGAGPAGAWIGFGAGSLVVTIAVWPAFAGTAAIRAGAPGGPRRPPWSPDRLLLVLCYGAYGFGYIIPATFLPAMARAVISDPAVFGWAWPLFGAAAAVSALSAAALGARATSRRLWAGHQLVMAVGVALPACVPGLAGILAAGLLVGGTFIAVTLLAVQEAYARAGQDATGLISLMTAAFAVGQIVGPLVAGYVAGTTGSYAGPLAMAAGLLALSALALLPRPPALRSE